MELVNPKFKSLEALARFCDPQPEEDKNYLDI